MSPNDPVKDAKARFFWRIGQRCLLTTISNIYVAIVYIILLSFISSCLFYWILCLQCTRRPDTTKFPSLNMDPVIPPEIPEWRTVMDMWGNKMLTAVEVLAQMLAEGFDLPADDFTKRMHCGPHLLAPTGSDYSVFNQEGTILAGFHTDLNFLTIHGKSRFPGLSIWTRNGKRMSVSVPDGCLLVQAGKQIEYLTGGYVKAGYHEVRVFLHLQSSSCLSDVGISTNICMLSIQLYFDLLSLKLSLSRSSSTRPQ